MINFRYHVVSLAAVLFALAGGIALGAGVLHDDDDATVGVEGVATRGNPELTAFDITYAQRTAAGLVAGRLKDQTVTIFTLPGVDGTQVDGIVAAINAAGGSVVNRVTLLPKLVAASGRQFVESVAQQSTSGVEGMPTDGDGYTRVGAALARAYLAKAPADVDAAGSTISSAFVQGDLVELDGPLGKRAGLALLVVGGTSAAETDGQATIVQALAAAFDGFSRGTVVAGPSASSLDDGYVAAIRSSPAATTVSTVDVLDSAGGRNLVALVLAKEAAGQTGAYGTARSANGALPTG